MNKIEILVKKLNEQAVVPTYAHNGDVCMDLTAINVEYDDEHDMYIYHTGLAFASDFNIGQFLFLRSGNCKKECYLCNGVGIADSAIYRGEIQLRMKLRDSIETMAAVEYLKNENSGSRFSDILAEMKERAMKLEFAPYEIGDRIGQMLFIEYPDVDLKVVEELNDTERGSGAFGSTGK